MILDERYCVSEDAIQDAFLLLLEEKALDRITVSDVIRKAGIVRSTFYNHYENIPALISAVEDKTIDDIFHLLEAFRAKNNTEICRTYFLTLCEYTKNNPFLSGLLRSPNSNAFFEKSLTMLHRYVTSVMQSYHESAEDRETYSYRIAGIIGSVIGILHKWTRENFAAPEETIADLLTQNFMGTVMPYLS